MVDFSLLSRLGREPRRYAAGETIFANGDAAGGPMYALKSGAVEIRVRGKVIETVRAGGVFGEMSLIEHAPRSADAVAVEPAEAIEVDEKTFVFLVQETPYFALNVMRTLASRLRAMNEKL